MGVSPSIPTLVWATFGQRYDPADGKYDNEPFLKWAVNVSATKGPIPYIFSLSYQACRRFVVCFLVFFLGGYLLF